MRLLLQRVSSASVRVEGRECGAIAGGLVAFVGIGHSDTPQIVERMAVKVVDLRIFGDEMGKMNRSLRDLCGNPNPSVNMLVVSQFTLYADVRTGRRPGFSDAAPPDQARMLVDHFAGHVQGLGVPIALGEFGAHMVVSLQNDGPVTIWIDSATLPGSP